jgi:hypothetical protein
VFEIVGPHPLGKYIGLLLFGVDLLGDDGRSQHSKKLVVLAGNVVSLRSEARQALHVAVHNTQGSFVVFPYAGDGCSRILWDLHNGGDGFQCVPQWQEGTHSLRGYNVLCFTSGQCNLSLKFALPNHRYVSKGYDISFAASNR